MAILSKLALNLTTKGGEKVKKDLQNIDKQAEKTGKRMNASFNPKVAAAFAAGMTAAVAEVTRAFREWLTVMDKIQKQSIQTGLAANMIDQFRIMEKFSGLAADTMTRSYLYFKRQVGSGAKDDVLSTMLGITPAQLEGKKKDVEKLWRDVTRVIQRMDENDPNKNNLVNQLFGEDSGRELLKLLNLSGVEFEGLVRQSERLANANEENVAQAAAFNDAVTSLSEQWQNLMESVIANDDPFGLVAAIDSAHILLRLFQGLSKIQDSMTSGASDQAMNDFLPGGYNPGQGGMGVFNSASSLLGGFQWTGDFYRNNKAGNDWLKRYENLFDRNTGEFRVPEGFDINEFMSEGNRLLAEDERLRAQFVTRSEGVMGTEDAQRTYSGMSDWSPTRNAMAELEKQQGKIDQDRVDDLNEQVRLAKEFADNYEADSLGAFGMGGVPYADASSIIARPSGPDASYDPVRAGLDAAFNPEDERAAQQEEYERMAQAMGEEVAIALGDSGVLPEASMWTNVLDDLREQNQILRMVDGKLEIIAQKDPVKVGIK